MDWCPTLKLGSRALTGKRPKFSRIHSLSSFSSSSKTEVEMVRNQVNILFQPGKEDEAIGRITLEYKAKLISINKALHLYTFALTSSPREFPLWLKRIQQLPQVKTAEPNYTARTAMIPQDQYYSSHNKDSLKTLNLEKAWDITTGSPQIVVAVLDTGIDANHEDLQGNIDPRGWDFIGNDPLPDDESGHGTAMAGLIAAQGNNGKGIIGVAWKCKILPLKVADQNGVASFSDLAQAITYAADKSVQIISLSLGSPSSSAILQQAVQYAYQKGVVLIGAAGNDMIHRDRYPAAYPEVLSVASIGPDGDLGLVTNLSPKTDLAAPGEFLWSTAPGDFYALVEGTSVSAALTSGVAALVLSQNPSLDNRQVYEILRQATLPIPALTGQGDRFHFGRLDALTALKRSQNNYPDMALQKIELLPARPKAGSSFQVSIRLRNEGTTSVASSTFSLWQDGQQVQSQTLSGLAPGDTRDLTFTLQSGSVGNHTLEGRIDALTGETELADNSYQLSYSAQTADHQDLEVLDLSVPTPLLQSGSIALEGTVLNRGNAEAPVRVKALIDGKEIGSHTFSLAAGQKRAVQFSWKGPSTPPKEILLYQLQIEPVAGETALYNNLAGYSFLLIDPALSNPTVQYAQKGGIDFNADAPYRIVPGRNYVPVMIFIPDKGAKSTSSYLTISKIQIHTQDQPQTSAPKTLLYQDSYGSPPTATVNGLEITDEEGQVVTQGGSADLNIFQDQPIRLRGRHNFLRFPRSALGISNQPQTLQEKYISVDISWRYYRHLFWIFYYVRTGTYHKTLKVHFPSEDLPKFAGEGRYYDGHFHTVAEWFFAPMYKLLAPKKAWGAPIQMIKENAYAWGFTDRVDHVKDVIITTDHNCFYETDSNRNSSDERPPVGPTSLASNQKPGGGYYEEREAYKRIFGMTTGEEVTFTKFPLGSHMLVYRAQHFSGNWNAGSLPLIGGSKLQFDYVMGTMAKQNRTENADAFSYAAHPYSSGLGWASDRLSQALQMDSQHRDDRYVHAGKKEFVFKGIQAWNGKHERSLPTSDIHFTNLNPFVNSSWQQGNTHWTSSVNGPLVEWHKYISRLLEFSFNSSPNEKFIRKVYITAGSDAHGDSNYSDGRLATVLPVQSTYSANSNAWGRARIYALGDGKPGATDKERTLKAYEDGNTIITDGPLLKVSIDGNGYFDSKNLVWHDKSFQGEDRDGQIGGGGSGFDGERTMLVVKGSPHVIFRYIHENTAEFGTNGGEIKSIKIYKDEPGAPNPTHSVGSVTRPKGVGSLAPGQNGQDLEEALDPKEEGTINNVCAFSFGAFTGGDPDKALLGLGEYRCYTNAIWAVPVDFQIQVTQIDNTLHQIPAGGLKVKLTFGISMDPSTPLELQVKALDQSGNSTNQLQPAISGFQTVGSGWSNNAQGVKGAVFEGTNTDPIPLSGAQYPGPDEYTFVVYTSKKPKDIGGNNLNPLAQKFTLNYANPAQPVIITASPISSSGTGGAPSGSSSGGGGGGCSLTTGPLSGAGIVGMFLPLVLLMLSVMGLRRRKK